MTTTDTKNAAQQYHEAWSSGAGADTMRRVMASDFVFSMGEMRIEGREAFLNGGGWPTGVEVAMVAQAYDGEHGFQLYDCSRGDLTVRMCEHFTVRDGAVVAVELFVDHEALAAFMSE